MISIDIIKEGMVGYFTNEKKIIIHWGQNEILMTGDQAFKIKHDVMT